MVHDVPVLLQPRCPPQDDPEIERLLELLRSAAGAPWIGLQLRADGDDEHSLYGVDHRAEQGIAIPLTLASRFAATVTVPSGVQLDDTFSSLAAFAVDKVLSIRRLREQVVLLRGALDATTSSILLFDSACQIIFANPPADRLLSRQTEDALVVTTLRGATQPLFNHLCYLVEHINSNPEQRTSWRGSLSLSDGSQFACEVIRVTLAERSTAAGVLVHLQEMAPLAVRALADFCLDYGLSPREEEVSRLILEGLTTTEIAGRLGISPHTVRDHVKHVYRKTSTTSRSELLALMTAADPGVHRSARTRPR